jgi:hypothetical protein
MVQDTTGDRVMKIAEQMSNHRSKQMAKNTWGQIPKTKPSIRSIESPKTERFGAQRSSTVDFTNGFQVLNGHCELVKICRVTNWSLVCHTSHNDSRKLITPNATDRDDIELFYFLSGCGKFSWSLRVIEPSFLWKDRVLETFSPMICKKVQGKGRMVRIIMVRPKLDDLIHRNRHTGAFPSCLNVAHCCSMAPRELLVVIPESSRPKGHQELIS